MGGQLTDLSANTGVAVGDLVAGWNASAQKLGVKLPTRKGD